MGERQAPRVGGTRPPKNPSRNPSSSPSPTPTFRAPQIGPFLLPSRGAPQPPHLPSRPPACTASARFDSKEAGRYLLVRSFLVLNLLQCKRGSLKCHGGRGKKTVRNHAKAQTPHQYPDLPAPGARPQELRQVLRGAETRPQSSRAAPRSWGTASLPAPGIPGQKNLAACRARHWRAFWKCFPLGKRGSSLGDLGVLRL